MTVKNIDLGDVLNIENGKYRMQVIKDSNDNVNTLILPCDKMPESLWFTVDCPDGYESISDIMDMYYEEFEEYSMVIETGEWYGWQIFSKEQHKRS